MSVSSERPIDVVGAALEHPEGPTEDQVKRICQLSYDKDFRMELQRNIDQLLKSPGSYAQHEVQNAKTLMKNCLPDAAPEFVTFCVAEFQLMNYEGIENAEDGREVDYPPAEAMPAPMPAPLTPPASPLEQRNQPSPPRQTSYPTSPKPSVTPPMDAGKAHDSPHLPAPSTPPCESILLFPKEEVAAMTFGSSEDGLETVLGAVADLGKYSSPMRTRQEDLLKALECVQHCLFHGSPPFVEYCAQNIWIFSYLRRQSPLIQPTANAIFDFLAEKNRPGERKPPPSSSPPNKTHPPADSSPQYPTVARTPKKNPLPTPKPTPPKPPINLEHRERHHNVSSPATQQGIVPSASLFLLRKEDVATMSFQSEGGKMAATLVAVNDLKRSDSSVRRHPDKLVKALDCIRYCLVWGSAPFVARCREQKTMFNLLRQHSNQEVRDCANAIFGFLKGYPYLYDKAPLIKHATMPSPSASAPTNQTYENTLVFEHGLDISKCVTRRGIEPLAKGYHADIWEGVYGTNYGEEIVAIKFLLRLSNVPGSVLQHHLNYQLPLWRSLFHSNISPLRGIVLESATVGLVSPHYLRGNVLDFLKDNQIVNPSKLLQGIAGGVAYLHANGIIHGNIKCSNVMIGDDGMPKLIDIGVAQVIDVAAGMGHTTSAVSSSLRWSAPELFAGAPRSEKSDVYALASTYVEMITLREPYSGLSDAQVFHRVKSGGMPPRPTTVHKSSPKDDFWMFLRACWNMLPQDRPNIVSMRRKLADI